MNKKIVFVNVIVFILLLITSICTIMFFFSNDSDSASNWFKKSERGYTITCKEIGKASWGGTSRARIEIYDSEKNKIIIQFETGIQTNGKSLSDNNYNLSINDDHISIAFFNDNGSLSGTYRFYYKDFKNDNSNSDN